MATTLTALAGAIDRFRRWTRWPDWGDSKLAWLGTACYYLALANDWSFAHTVAVMVRVFPFVIGLAALGYAVNDYWDRDTDVAVGKRAPASTLGLAGHRRLIAVLLGVTMLATLLLDARGMVAGLALLALGVAYSAPPLRLKIRGVWGVLSGAVVQWGTPVLPLLVGGAAPTSGFTLLFTMGLSAGVRWMLLHQMLDAAHDTRVGLRTFTTEQGIARAATVLRLLVGLETGVLVTWTLVEGRPVVAAVSGAYLAAYTLVMLRLWRSGQLGDPRTSYERAPFRGLYLGWMPLSFLLALVPLQPAYGWLVVSELWWKRYQLGGDLRLAWRARQAFPAVEPMTRDACPTETSRPFRCPDR